MARRAKADITRQFSIEQENALDLLVMGKSDRVVGELVGVSRQTVNEWQHDYWFRQELNKRRLALFADQVGQLQGLVSRAIEVLAEDLQAEDLKMRQTAAIHILRTVGLYGKSLKPSKYDNMLDFD